MPVKRRKSKARQIDDAEIYELQYGPGEFLINGTGYMAEARHVIWTNLAATEQADIIETMRADWVLHHRKVWQAWADRGEHDLWCAERHYGSPTEPWAQRQFGDPA